MEEIKIKTPVIQLDQLLKWANVVASGGEAKQIIQAGLVTVNGEIETRRSVKINPGAIISIQDGPEFKVCRDN